MPNHDGQKQEVLFQIGDTVRQRVEREKTQRPLALLKQNLADNARQTHNFIELFRCPTQSFPVIAEIKKASPSQGDIAAHLNHLEVAQQYLEHGAAALSVLTEESYFKGQISYLRDIRQAYPEARLLMKDFFVDSYQLYQAREAGADAILIIVALLGEDESARLLTEARQLGLCPLVEVHTEEELHIAANIGSDLIGINSRNLKDLSISLQRIVDLLPKVPKDACVIGESGIHTHEDLCLLRDAGCHGFLVGTRLMQTGEPGRALSELLQAKG